MLISGILILAFFLWIGIVAVVGEKEETIAEQAIRERRERERRGEKAR